MTLEQAQALDATDPLGSYRAQFMCPDGVIYLDGNSLGQLPLSTVTAGAELLNHAGPAVDQQLERRLD